MPIPSLTEKHVLPFSPDPVHACIWQELEQTFGGKKRESAKRQEILRGLRMYLAQLRQQFADVIDQILIDGSFAGFYRENQESPRPPSDVDIIVLFSTNAIAMPPHRTILLKQLLDRSFALNKHRVDVHPRYASLELEKGILRDFTTHYPGRTRKGILRLEDWRSL